jgi:uncharacterized protein involved in tolerance to divalent cations
MTDKIVLFTTVSSPEEADRLARALVDRRLAACVNILPQARSVYRWQGAVEESNELLSLIKSRLLAVRSAARGGPRPAPLRCSRTDRSSGCGRLCALP